MGTKFLRLLFVILFTFSFSLFTFSQTGAPVSPKKKKVKRVTIGWSEGKNQPKGDFAATATTKLPMSTRTGQDTNSMNGYAITKYSFHWDIFLTYKIIPHLGAMVEVSSDQDNFDINTLRAQYIAYFPPNTVTANTGDNYFITQYLAGLNYNIPIYPKNDFKTPSSYFLQQLQGKFSFEIKALVGPTSASYPGIAYFADYDPVNSTYTNYTIITFPDGKGFGYNFGGGIKYSGEVEKWLAFGVHLNVNYMGSEITYPSYTSTHYNTSYVSTTFNYPKTMAVSILQYTLGATFEF